MCFSINGRFLIYEVYEKIIQGEIVESVYSVWRLTGKGFGKNIANIFILQEINRKVNILKTDLNELRHD